MNEQDAETKEFVEHRSRRMMSTAIYRKLRSVVDSWQQEEIGKAKVLAGAGYGLVVWLLAAAASYFILGGWTPVLAIGFVAWIAFIAYLIRKHLS